MMPRTKRRYCGRSSFGVVHDEDALDVELDADLVLGLVEVEGALDGDEEEGGVFERTFGPGVEPEERVLGVAGDGLVELLVVVVGELGFGAAPEGAGGVDLLGGADLDRTSSRSSFHSLLS